MAGTSFKVEFTNTLTKGMERYFKKVGISQTTTTGADKKAKTMIGLQLIRFVIEGSSKQSVVPPVWWGMLRAAGSVFVGGEFVGGNNLYPIQPQSGTHKSEKANMSHSAPISTVTVGFNTSYAARMHETDWNPGPRSRKSGDVGNKFVEKHLKSDGNTLIKMYSDILKKESGG